MDITAFPPVAALLDGVTNLLTTLSGLLTPFAGTAATALAIVLLTVVVRAATIPLGGAQVRAEVTRRRIAPRLHALQKRYAKDPQRLQQKMAELYRDEGTSPFAGMWTALVQLPVVSVLYTVFGHATIGGHANALLGDTLFGVPLGTSLGSLLGGQGGGAGGLWPALPVILGVLAALAVTAVFSRRQVLVVARAGGAEPTTLTKVLASSAFLSVVFAALAPLSAGIYLVVTTTWTLIERTLWRRRLDPLFSPGRPALEG